MSIINFPTNPQVNDTYSFGTRTWQWNGSAWVLTASGIVGPSGPTGPTGPLPVGYATTGSNTFIGNQIVTGSLLITQPITGSLNGTASNATSAVTASFANETNWSGIRNIPAGIYSSSAQLPAGTISSSAQLPAGTISSSTQITSLTNATLSGSSVISGSTQGNIVALSIASSTASLNASAGSFYTLLLVSGSTTRVEPTGIIGGRTFTLRVKQASVASGSVVFSSTFKFPTGSAYTPTSTANAEDILSFITFDTGSIYAVSTKQMV